MSRKQSSSAPAVSYSAACSTGSPASRSDTKLTPLTTRPSFTSRQGMTRNFSMVPLLRIGARQHGKLLVHRMGSRATLLCSVRHQCQCLPGLHAAIVEGTADDDALDSGPRGGGAEID